MDGLYFINKLVSVQLVIHRLLKTRYYYTFYHIYQFNLKTIDEQ